MNEPSTIRHLLDSRTIAVIGLSANPDKPSHYVPAYLQAAGYRILPVNPLVQEVLGERSYPSLAALPEKPDLVNVFRLPHFVGPIVDEMIALKLRAIWIQSRIVNPDAAAKAEAHGIQVVMDRCIMVESRHARANLR